MAVELLFVYGTLMRGFRLHNLLAGRAQYVGEGEVAGLLFDLGSYPAAIRGGGGSIRGEVYRLADPGLWVALDSAEGSQYHRGEVGVRMAIGEQVSASIYWYVGPLGGAVPIPGGDYRAHSPVKSIPSRLIHSRRHPMSVQPAELIKSDQDHLIHPLHHPSDHLEPMVYVKGRGATITDIQGREYIDGLAGLWNTNVGHGREELAKAAAAQMSDLAYFSAYAGSSNIPAVQLAEKLISISYPNMQGVFFTCGGAESNESAFKTARFYWKAKGKPDKVKIIARQLAYHGVTLQAMSATGMSPYWKMFEPRVPNFVHIPTCYPYRQEGAKPGETAGQTAARLLEEAILREGPDTVAAFIAEPIHGGGGVLYPTDDYFPLVRKVCDKHQVLFIADEVITGFCRTGHWFAMTHWNVLPDIVSFAKGVSSGYLPLGGIMVSKDVKEAMDSVKPEDKWMHAYTYSGHPTCCAVGLKNVEIMEREKLAERSATLGTRLHKALHSAFDSHPNVGDIRSGKGLLAAIELVEDKATKKAYGADQKVGARILQEMTKRGVITRARMEHVFFSPALVITEAELDRMVSVTQEAIKAVTGT